MKILYTINVDWFFISHFLPVALEAKKRGYEVHIACGLTNKQEYLENFGFTIHKLDISRSGTSMVKEFISIVQIYKILKDVNPEIVEFLTIKPVLYGGIISKLLSPRKKVFYITGLGYVFIQKGFKGLIVKSIVKTLYRMALFGKNTTVITENIFDKGLIGSLNVLAKNQIKIIKGAGVDLEKYTYIEEKNANITIVMVSRLLKDKGVYEYIESARIIKNKGFNVNFKLYGDVDKGNPTSMTSYEITKIKEAGYISVEGFTNNVAKVFSNANIVVLPSYREGFPKVLIEAAACGRAIVTTDVAGCRDAIDVDKTGLLCEVKNAQSLADKVERLIVDTNLRNRMGKDGHKLAEKEFSIDKILQEHFKAYKE